MNKILHSKTAQAIILLLAVVIGSACTILLALNNKEFRPQFVFFLFSFAAASIAEIGVLKLLTDLVCLKKKWLLTLISAVICVAFELITLYIDFYTAMFTYPEQILFYVEEQIFSYTVMYLAVFAVSVVFIRIYCGGRAAKSATKA